MRRLAVGCVVLALVACGGDGGDEAENTDTPTVETTEAAATPAETYLSRSRNRGLGEFAVPVDEVEDIAANLCDNTVSDFEFLASSMEVIYDDTERALVLTDRRLLVDSFCPERLLQFDEAMESTGISSRIDD